MQIAASVFTEFGLRASAQGLALESFQLTLRLIIPAGALVSKSTQEPVGYGSVGSKGFGIYPNYTRNPEP